MGSLTSPCTTSYRSSIETIALDCFKVFKKIAFFCILATERQTDRRITSMHKDALAVASGGLTSSSAVAKRPCDASCLSVVSFIASIVQYIEHSFLLLVMSASDLPVRTIRFCSVVFSVIHTIHGGPWLCIVRDRAWSLSHCKATVPACPQQTKSRSQVRYKTTVQQLLIAKPDIRWESRF